MRAGQRASRLAARQIPRVQRLVPDTRRATFALLALLALACAIETIPRLGANSPFHRFVLPASGLEYFWETPLGWTGLVDGTPVNRDSVQFEALASFLRDSPRAVVPLEDNV